MQYVDKILRRSPLKCFGSPIRDLEIQQKYFPRECLSDLPKAVPPIQVQWIWPIMPTVVVDLPTTYTGTVVLNLPPFHLWAMALITVIDRRSYFYFEKMFFWCRVQCIYSICTYNLVFFDLRCCFSSHVRQTHGYP